MGHSQHLGMTVAAEKVGARERQLGSGALSWLQLGPPLILKHTATCALSSS